MAGTPTRTPSKYDTDWFTDADELGKPKVGLGERRNTAAVTEAQALVEAFRKRSGGGQFKHLDRAKIASGLAHRIAFPDSFNQGDTFLCGIATVVRVWAFDHPVQYVKLAIDLYEKGEGKFEGHAKHGGQEVKPSKTLKESPPRKLGEDPASEYLDHADWIVLASVREAFNRFWEYSADEGVERFRAWNFPGDVEDEFKALGYSKILNKASLGGGGWNNFEEAADLFEKGWRVILMIHSNMLSLTDYGKTPAINRSNHFIGLDSGVRFNIFGPRRMVEPFKVYSWDGQYTVPRDGRATPFDVLDRHYFGFIAALF